MCLGGSIVTLRAEATRGPDSRRRRGSSGGEGGPGSVGDLVGSPTPVRRPEMYGCGTEVANRNRVWLFDRRAHLGAGRSVPGPKETAHSASAVLRRSPHISLKRYPFMTARWDPRRFLGERDGLLPHRTRHRDKRNDGDALHDAPCRNQSHVRDSSELYRNSGLAARRPSTVCRVKATS